MKQTDCVSALMLPMNVNCSSCSLTLGPCAGCDITSEEFCVPVLKECDEYSIFVETWILCIRGFHCSIQFKIEM